MSESLFEQYKAALRRGHMAALAGELQGALAAYDDAARLVPERALPLASRGTVLHRLDRWSEAAEAFDRALQIAPDDEASLRARATARAERGLRSGAATDFERLAFVLDVAGRAAAAAEAAGRAAELEPTGARAALAERLGAAAAHLADLVPPAPGTDPGAASFEARQPDAAAADLERGSDLAPDGDGMSTEADGWDRDRRAGIAGEESLAGADPWSAALDERRLAGLGDGGSQAEDHGASDDDARATTETATAIDGGAYDALDTLRAEMDTADAAPSGIEDGSAQAPTAKAATMGEPGAAHEPAEAGEGPGAAAETVTNEGALDGTWPGIDLPSPPPPRIEGPPPDPEDLLTEAALVLEQGEVDAARDLMLTAARVHRDAGRIDAALEVCLNLLSIAPGDPRVHLAIANLQLDRGWTGIAKEKIDLLVRLTSLTGDTQAEADVHGLASERLRDEPAPSTAGR